MGELGKSTTPGTVTSSTPTSSRRFHHRCVQIPVSFRGTIKPGGPIMGWEHTAAYTPLILREIGIASESANYS